MEILLQEHHICPDYKYFWNSSRLPNLGALPNLLDDFTGIHRFLRPHSSDISACAAYCPAARETKVLAALKTSSNACHVCNLFDKVSFCTHYLDDSQQLIIKISYNGSQQRNFNVHHSESTLLSFLADLQLLLPHLCVPHYEENLFSKPASYIDWLLQHIVTLLGHDGRTLLLLFLNSTDYDKEVVPLREHVRCSAVRRKNRSMYNVMKNTTQMAASTLLSGWRLEQGTRKGENSTITYVNLYASNLEALHNALFRFRRLLNSCNKACLSLFGSNNSDTSNGIKTQVTYAEDQLHLAMESLIEILRIHGFTKIGLLEPNIKDLHEEKNLELHSCLSHSAGPPKNMATSQNQETFKSTDSLTKDENVENGLLEKVFPELSCFLDRFNNRGVELFLSCSNEVWDMVCSIVDSLIDFLRRAAECAYNFELEKTSRAQSLNNEEIDEQKQSKYFVVRDLFDEFNTGLSSHFLRPCLFTLYVFFSAFCETFRAVENKPN